MPVGLLDRQRQPFGVEGEWPIGMRGRVQIHSTPVAPMLTSPHLGRSPGSGGSAGVCSRSGSSLMSGSPSR